VKAYRFTGDLEDDPPAAAQAWSLGCRGMQQDGDEIVAWFDAERSLPFGGRWEDEDGVDWIAAYLAGLDPVELESLVVAPTHAQVLLTVPRKVLWLDPGMAFGTGHHQTTRMALETLEEIALQDERSLAGRRVLDVGTGSGILAIAADLLAASDALGVDVDPVAITVAEGNARLNRSRARFELGSTAEVLAAGESAWSLLLANLYAELHVRLLASFEALLAPGGRALLTGILAERLEQVEAALPAGLRTLSVRSDGPWRLLLIERRESVR